jgi:TolA-binding protein
VDEAWKAEQDAARKLKFAKELAQAGSEETANRNFAEAERLFGHARAGYKAIIKQYPNTRAAAEARELLGK